MTSIVIFNASDVKQMSVEGNTVTSIKLKRKYGPKFKRPVVEIKPKNK